MASLGTLAVNIVARTSKFSQGISKSLGLTNKFAKGIGSAGLAVSAFAATTGLAAGSVVRSYEQINSAMTKSLAIMGDVSEEQRQVMIRSALEVARVTQKTTTQAAESYFFLASAGMDAVTAVEAMPVVARFAQAGNFDMALATDLATDAQSALGLSSKNTAEAIRNLTRVTDVLVKGNTLANSSVQQFSEAITSGAGGAMRLANMQMEQGVAVLAAFADQGIKGAEAGTAFGIVLRDLQTKALQNKFAFAAAGVSVFDANGALNNMADIVEDLEELLGPLSVAQRKSTLMMLGFSDKSVKFAQALVGTSSKIREWEKGLRGAGGAAKEIAGKSMTDLQKATAQMAASWDKMALAIGAAAERLGAFKGAAEFMEGVGIILDRIPGVKASQETSGPQSRMGKTRGYGEAFSDAVYGTLFGTAGKPLSDALYSGLAGDGKGLPGMSQEWLDKQMQKSQPDYIAQQERAEKEAKANEAFNKASSKAVSALRGFAIKGISQFSAAAKGMAETDKALRIAMLDDALHDATFGFFGKKAHPGGTKKAEAIGHSFRQELVARRSDSVEGYAALRRNVGDKTAKTQVDLARQSLREQRRSNKLLASQEKPPVFTLGVA